MARADSPKPADTNGDVVGVVAAEKAPNAIEPVLLLPLELLLLLVLVFVVELLVKLSNFCEIPPRTFTISLCCVLLGNAYISFKCDSYVIELACL